MKLWLIFAYLLFAEQETTGNSSIMAAMLFVIEQTDQFQKYGKKSRKYEFKKIKSLIF